MFSILWHYIELLSGGGGDPLVDDCPAESWQKREEAKDAEEDGQDDLGASSYCSTDPSTGCHFIVINRAQVRH